MPLRRPPPWRPECRRVARVLQAYLDGELGPEEAPLVAEHLRHCHRCGIDAAIFEDIRRSLQELATSPDHGALARLRSYAAHLEQDTDA